MRTVGVISYLIAKISRTSLNLDTLSVFTDKVLISDVICAIKGWSNLILFVPIFITYLPVPIDVLFKISFLIKTSIISMHHFLDLIFKIPQSFLIAVQSLSIPFV